LLINNPLDLRIIQNDAKRIKKIQHKYLIQNLKKVLVGEFENGF